jgi:xanthine/CO dehydrogenase XdhC/CoxF family maturation factor
MKDINTIVEKQKALAEQGIESVLATVVQISGSAYRRPGAHMLIGRNGDKAGTISGGCLEGDVIEHAAKVFTNPKPLLLQYNIDDEYDKIFGTGSGCNGSVSILLEPLITTTKIKTTKINPLEVYAQCLKDNKKRALVTIFAVDTNDSKEPAVKQGKHALLDELGGWSTEIPCPELNAQILDDARHCLSTGQSTSREYNFQSGRYATLIEMIQSPIKLVIFGAGDDVIPVVAFAKQLGWQTCIADPRPAFATSERFALADTVLCLRPEEIDLKVVLDERTAVVLMSHNFQFDLAALKHLKHSFSHAFQLPYLGILGPKKRTNEIFAELSESDFAFWKAKVTALNFPIGLDLGAETPQEIALSIISEIQAVFALGEKQSHVEFLKNRQGPIHPPETKSTEPSQSDDVEPLTKVTKQENIPCPISKAK